MIPRSKSKGFTLIEVLVSLVILAIAVLGFHEGQAGGVRIALRAEMRAQAYALAQKQMTETELQLRNKDLSGFLDEEKGTFKEEEFKRFRWVRTMDKVEAGCFLPEPANDSPDMGFFQMATKFFEQAIRKISITVVWEENKKPQTVTLSQLFVKWSALPDLP